LPSAAFGDDESCDVNLVFFERHINTPWKEVVEMLNESIGAIIGEVQRRDEPAFAAANPHDDRGNPLWVGIAYYGVAHSLTHLAQAIARAGNARRAVHLQRTMTPFLLAINTGDAWTGMVLLYLARVLSISGELEEAVSKYQEAIALNPGLVDHVADEPDLEPIRGRV
jgi:hypothetical protein